MAVDKTSLRTEVLTRLSDLAQRVWTTAEVDEYLDDGLRQMSRLRLWWDTVYAENLPPTFSQTASWESAYSDVYSGTANYTMDDERTLGGEETSRIGPAWTTGTFEATDGYLDDLGNLADVPATSDLPARVLEVERGVWDGRGIDAYAPGDFAGRDARYEITRGEVYGYIWRKDGARTIRKVRVPAAMAATHEVTGSWGLLREPEDISDTTITGTWGLPRWIPGEHPIGFTHWGFPRRVYRDGTNVRFEHYRQARPFDDRNGASELPDRWGVYLRHYAMARCLSRQSAGQDMALGAWYESLWARSLMRLQRRLDRRWSGRTAVLGGGPRRMSVKPPRPRLPWNYGATTRP